MDRAATVRLTVGLVAALGAVGFFVVTASPVAAHGGAHVTTTPVQEADAGIDAARVGLALGVGAVAAALAGIVLWLRNG